MLDQIIQPISRKSLLKTLSNKAGVFLILLFGYTLGVIFFPMVARHLSGLFDLPFELMKYSSTFPSVVLAIVIIVLAWRDEIPGAILIGLLAIQEPVFSCILYLLSYILKNISLNEKR